MTIYKQEVVVVNKNDLIVKLEGLTGKQCYDKYGLKRDECVTETVTFENGYQADVKMCVCDEDYTCFAEVVLFNEKGGQVGMTYDVADSVIGEWHLEDDNGNVYEIEVFEGIKCPYCNTVSEDCDFPDLFYSDINNTEGLNEQYRLLQELQSKGYNLVTCGDCGKVFITKGRV